MHTSTRLIAVLGFAVATASCGGSTSNTTTTPAVTVPTATLEKVVLAPADLGAGWTAGSALNADDLASLGQQPCTGVPIDTALATRLEARLGAQFDPVDHSHRTVLELVITGDRQQLATDLQDIHDAAVSCGGTHTNLALPAIGDQQLGMTASTPTATGAASTWLTRTALVRKGAIAVEVSVTEVLATAATAPLMTDAAFVTLVQTATAKLPAS